VNAHTVVIAALVLNAALGFGYRVFRLAKGGPIADVIGQAVLGVVLLGIAGALAAGASWAEWAAAVYGALFGLLVMPVWVLAVLLPLRPGVPDYAFTAVYWAGALTVAVAAVVA
jgi:hypothetical protein